MEYSCPRDHCAYSSTDLSNVNRHERQSHACFEPATVFSDDHSQADDVGTEEVDNLPADVDEVDEGACGDDEENGYPYEEPRSITYAMQLSSMFEEAFANNDYDDDEPSYSSDEMPYPRSPDEDPPNQPDVEEVTQLAFPSHVYMTLYNVQTYR
jgi:hypothetical protein